MQTGTQISHYRVLEQLGSGGMGAVWLAEDIRLERKVALKVLLPKVAQDATARERFSREARAASALSHPNIAHLYEIGEEDGVFFLVMEYVEGESLQQRVKDHPLAVADVLALGAQIADALDDAHSKGIIHRDIKPSNVMITSRGHAKVLDFGLAKVLPPKPEERLDSSADTRLLTSAGTMLGTAQYMSPEQAMGRAVDTRSDLFSLGALLYYMATGRMAFPGENSQEVLAKLLQSQPEAIGRLNYEVPEALERVIRKCLEKDREIRYQSAREIVIDLRGLSRETPSPSGQTPAAQGVRAVVVDDEDLARGLLREFLRSAPDVEVVGECANGFEAVKVIGELKPDLVFLDVQMPKLDGFEVLELIDPSIAVVFTTAYDQYAMKALDAHAVDYLLKPFSLDRLQTALTRARSRITQTSAATQPAAVPAPELAVAARSPENQPQRIVVKDGSKVHIIPLDKLDYVEAQDDYIALHSEKRSFLKQQTISSVEALLDPQKFVRIHRSYIVNLERIARIEPYTKDSRVVVLKDGTQLPVSRSGHGRLKDLLG
ncbi:MAG: protein kinase [Bryobacteraceae bacterium]